MPDPVSGRPNRPLPGAPAVTPVDRPGSAPSVTTAGLGAAPVSDTPVADLMDRGNRPHNNVANPPLALNRTVTSGDAGNPGGARALDVRLDANGAMARGNRTRTTTTGDTTRTVSDGVQVGVDSQAFGANAERSTVVDGPTGHATRTNSAGVHVTPDGQVTGSVGSSGDVTVRNPDGSARRTVDSTNLTVDGNHVAGVVDVGRETLNTDGSNHVLTGHLDGTVDAGGARGTVRGRSVSTGPAGTTEIGGELTGGVDRHGVTGAGTATGVRERTTDGVTTRDTGTVTARHGGGGPSVDIAGSRTVVGPDGRLHVEASGGASLHGVRGRGTVETRDADGQTTVSGGVDVDANGTRGTAAFDAQRTHGNTTTGTFGTVNVNASGGRAGVDARGGRRSVTTVGTSTITRGFTANGAVGPDGGRAEVGVLRSTEDPSRGTRREVSGTLRGGMSGRNWTGGGTLAGNSATVTGNDRVEMRGNLDVNADNGGLALRGSGTRTATDLGTGAGYAVSLDAGLRSSTSGTDADVRLGAERRTLTENTSTNVAGNVTVTGTGVGAAGRVERADARTGRTHVVEVSGDTGSRSGEVTVGERRTDLATGGARDGRVTVGVDLDDRRGKVVVASADVTPDGRTASETHTRVDVQTPTDAQGPGAGVGHERVTRTDDSEFRRGIRAEWNASGVVTEGGYEFTENTPQGPVSNRVAARGELGVDRYDLRVDTLEARPDRTFSGVTTGLTVDGQGVLGTLGNSTGKDGQVLDRAGSVGLTNGGVRTGASVARTRGTTAESLAGRLTVGRNKLEALLAGSRDWDGKLGRMSVGFAVRGSSVREVKDEGAVTGTGVPELDGKHRVVTRAVRSGELGGRAGVAVGVFAAGAGVKGGREKAVTYITHMAPEDAALAVTENAGERLRNHVTTAVRPLPDAADPLKMSVGDELSIQSSGDIDMSADLGVCGIAVGGRVVLRGQFTFSVTRLPGEKVRVAVVPASIGSVALEGRALVAMASIEGSRAKALGQEYEFDLSTPGGREAYQAALEGRMPRLNEAAMADADRAVDVVKDMAATLPEGVTLLAASQESSRTTTRRLGWAWAFLGSDRARSTTETNRRVAEEGRVLTERSLANDRVVRTWLSGTETEGTYARLNQLTERGANGELVTSFRDVALGARFSDEKVKGNEFNTEVVRRLRDVLGLEVEDAGTGHKEKRAVEVSLVLTAEVLDALPPECTAQLEAAAGKAGADQAVARELGRTLGKARSAGARAEALQAFVQKEGLAGLGTILRAFPHVETSVQSSSSLYDDARTATDALVGRWGGPPAANVTEDDFATRHGEFVRANEALDKATEGARADSLLPAAERDALVADFSARREAIKTVMDVSGWTREERARLHKDLDRGWTNDNDYGAMRVLERAGI